MKVIKPPRLRTGDRVALISVSSPVPTSNDVDNMVHCLQKFGLKVMVDENVMDRIGFLAGPDDLRASALAKAIRDPEIRAVFFAWGGKGANHLLEHIDYDLLQRSPKIIVGLSDPSCIINAITKKSNIVTFHGPTGVNFADPNCLASFTESSFIRNLFGNGETPDSIPVPKFSPWVTLHEGRATGNLVGGHLSTIQTLLGTPYEPEWDNSIFFWEEVGRAPRAIDLSLWHFRLRGVFDKIAGMVIGRPLDCADPSYDDELDFQGTVLNAIRGFNFPVLFNVDLGHADPKVTIPVGVNAELLLNDNDDPIFNLLESGVQ